MQAARRRLLGLWLAAVSAGAMASCGSRTGLFYDDYLATSVGEPHKDVEAGARRDGGDGGDADLDALPPIDATPRPDVDRTDCPDADATYVYVVTSQNELFSFYPPGLSFRFIGNLVCPAQRGATPFSMAVDRKGVAFVVYTSGELFRVSTATAACTGTAWVPGASGLTTFGMGFASDTNGPAERLYIADSERTGGRGLATIDVTTFLPTIIGPFDPPLPRGELTGTGDGRLFTFWPDATGPTGSHVAEVEKSTAKVVAETDLPIGRPNDAFAFAFWGGDFWIFTSPGAASEVSRFRPASGTTQTLTTHPSTIVGAGVSTCAPQL